MKKLMTILSLLFLCQLSMAENIKIKVKAHKGEIITNGFTLGQMQGQLLCVFYSEKLGVQKVRRRYMQMLSKNVGEERYEFSVKKTSLTEWMPTFEIKSCAYKFIILGQKPNGKTALGDIVLAGAEHIVMSKEDIRQMEDRKWINEKVSSSIHPLSLVIGKDSKGRTRIIKK